MCVQQRIFVFALLVGFSLVWSCNLVDLDWPNNAFNHYYFANLKNFGAQKNIKTKAVKTVILFQKKSATERRGGKSNPDPLPRPMRLNAFSLDLTLTEAKMTAKKNVHVEAQTPRGHRGSKMAASPMQPDLKCKCPRIWPKEKPAQVPLGRVGGLELLEEPQDDNGVRPGGRVVHLGGVCRGHGWLNPPPQPSSKPGAEDPTWQGGFDRTKREAAQQTED